MSISFNLEKIYQYLLVFLAFLMPLSVAAANLVISIISLLWIFSGNYKYKLTNILSSKLMIASLLFFFLHVFGMLWTENLSWGFHMLHKMWYFLLFLPILHTLVRKKNISIYVSVFLLAITVTEVLSYLVWLQLIDPFKHATVANPTPFMTHVSYNPILAFAIYIVLHQIINNKKLTNVVLSIYVFFALTMTINMFITGGRAGQVGFFVMLAILIFQSFNKQILKSIIVTVILIPGIFFTAYNTSDLFNQRVNNAVNDTMSISNTTKSSVGIRVNFAINSFEIIKKNPILGVGTGDFPDEYKKVNSINSPLLPNTTNPHNMYTLVTAQLGIVGLLSMLSIFYYQIKLSFNSPSRLMRDAGLTLPLLFLVMMLSDSYLLGHFTTLVYVFFTSFLYKDFEKS